MNQVSATAAALYWQQLRERTPPLPPCLVAEMPDPNCRSAHFRWSERCRLWWLSQGVRLDDASNLWGALVAARLSATDPHWREHGVTAGVWRGWRAALLPQPRRRCGSRPAASAAATPG